jgi:hypothetical protein
VQRRRGRESHFTHGAQRRDGEGVLECGYMCRQLGRSARFDASWYSPGLAQPLRAIAGYDVICLLDERLAWGEVVKTRCRDIDIAIQPARQIHTGTAGGGSFVHRVLSPIALCEGRGGPAPGAAASHARVFAAGAPTCAAPPPQCVLELLQQ